jgi:DNA-binding transcriptional ArsR family regulator
MTSVIVLRTSLVEIARLLNFSTCHLLGGCYLFNQMVKHSPSHLNRTFAALADPTRRRILHQLTHGHDCVTRLARPYGMSLPAVSKHLRVLEKAGLIRRRRYGRVHQLELEAKPLKQAAQWVEEYRKFWEGSLDRLADYLEKTNKQSQTKRPA